MGWFKKEDKSFERWENKLKEANIIKEQIERSEKELKRLNHLLRLVQVKNGTIAQIEDYKRMRGSIRIKYGLNIKDIESCLVDAIRLHEKFIKESQNTGEHLIANIYEFSANARILYDIINTRCHHLSPWGSYSDTANSDIDLGLALDDWERREALDDEAAEATRVRDCKCELHTG